MEKQELKHKFALLSPFFSLSTRKPMQLLASSELWD